MNNQDPKVTSQQVTRWLASHKKLVALAAAFVFVLFLVLAVPAGQVPGLGRLARAMGFSADELNTYSFARAMLTWTAGDARRVAADEQEDGAVGIFSRQAEETRFDKNGPRSGLINLRAVNAWLFKQGRKTDGLKDSGFGKPGERTEDYRQVQVGRPVAGLGADLQRAAQAKGDVFFGEDLQQQEQLASFGNTLSADTSALLKKDGRFAGLGGKTDALNDWVEKAFALSDKQVEDGLKKAGAGSSALTNLNKDARSFRDLEYVLITSKAANRAPQLALKKTLASSGFTAAEMPKKIFDSTGSTAAPRVDNDAVVKDVGSTKEQLAREEKCRKASVSSSDVLGPALASARELSGLLGGRFPKTCTDTGGLSQWNSTISRLKSLCQTVQGVYSEMKSVCGLQVKSNGTCEVNALENQLDNFLESCALDPAFVPDLAAINKEVNQSFNIPVGDNEDVADDANPFFPESQIGGSQFL